MRGKPLSDLEYRWFSEWLTEEYGLRFGPERRDILRSRLDPRRAELGFDTFEQLYFHLKFHPDRDEERKRLIPHLTNNESYFFRESGQIDLLTSEVLRQTRDRLERGRRREIRLLSAGCAAGEEAYTLAIAAHESNVISEEWSVRVTGIDLDPDALERARVARYTENAFRRIPPGKREKYFTKTEDDRWELDESIRRLVTFNQANLSAADWAGRIQRQDIIFCRNVLIYFGEEAMRRAVDAFYEALEPGGALFLGHAESLSRIPTRFVAARRPGAVYYRKPEAGGE